MTELGWVREAIPRLRSCLFIEHEASQLVAQLLDLRGIIGGTKAFGQLEECFFLLLTGFDSLLDEFDQNAVIAEIAFLRQYLNLFGNFGRQRYASPDMFYTDCFCASSFHQCHCTNIHHFGA